MKTYCFDFDGTIADTLPLIMDTLNRLLKESGEEEISGDLMKSVRDEGVESVIKNMRFSPLKMFFIVRRAKLEMNKEIGKAKAKEGIGEVLKEIRSRGYSLGILSSNSRENVIDFLKESDLPLFDFVFTSGVFGKEKAIKRLKRQDVDFVYIGDEVRDIKAGKAAGVKTIAVSWGLSSRDSLQKAGADMVADDPQDILSFSL